jgi:hypothetical protein
LLGQILKLPALIDIVDQLTCHKKVEGLGLLRSGRMAVTAAIHQQSNQPLLYLIDRSDHALTAMDELSFWAGDTPGYYFSEPPPLFYENAIWDETVRRERLLTLGILAAYHVPGSEIPDKAPVIITTR